MYEKLPAPQDKVRRRLIEKWILSQPSMDDQIDGLVAILAAFKDIIEPMLGSVATRAVFRRTTMLARQRFPEWGHLPTAEVVLDVERVRADLSEKDADRACQAIVALVDALFAVLFGLLGPLLLQLLGDVEAQLRAPESRGRTDEEKR